MKKYFFILVIMTLSFNAFAQKKLLIYNFSSYDVTVSDIMTKHTTNNYPTVADYVADFTIPAGDFFELYTGHSLRFPFNATDSNSDLIIPLWAVQTSATNYTLPITDNANAVALAYGVNQVFHCIKYDDSFESGILGTSPLGTNEVILTQTTGFYEEFVSGTNIEYTLVIVDN